MKSTDSQSLQADIDRLNQQITELTASALETIRRAEDKLATLQSRPARYPTTWAAGLQIKNDRGEVATIQCVSPTGWITSALKDGSYVVGTQLSLQKRKWEVAA